MADSVPDLAKLTKEDCRILFRDGTGSEYERLLERFNFLVEQLARLRREIPAATAGNEGFRGLPLELHKVRQKMARERYLVGFCGRSQIGKSTTFNNVLRATVDPPAKQGRAGATTCAVMRLLPAPAGPNGLTKTYMTLDRYNEIRDKLCQAVGLTAPRDYSDADLLTKALPRLRQDAETGARKILDDNLTMLERLLQSAKGFDWARRGGQVENDNYDNRETILNHPKEGKAPSEGLLLDYATIRYATNEIPPTLEMIDLPGLGQTARDTALTERFLGELDGALLFYAASSVSEGVGEEILAELRRVFEGRKPLASRVWMVITYFDSLSEVNLYGTPSDPSTFFDTLRSQLTRHRLGPNQILFVCNEWYTEAAAGRRDPELARRQAKLRPGDARPPAVERDGIFADAYDAVLADGGIGRLRELVTSRLAEEVRRETGRWCDEKLSAIKGAMCDALRGELHKAEQGHDWLRNVNACLDHVVEARARLARRVEPFEKAANDLIAPLDALFTESFKDAPANNALSDLRVLSGRFNSHSQLLQGHLEAEAGPRLIRTLYDAIGNEMQALPAVDILGKTQGVAATWAAFRDADAVGGPWLEEFHFPGFLDDGLFAGLLKGTFDAPLNGGEYRKLMREKIRLVGQQAMHAVRMRLAYQLEQIGAALELLASNKGGRVAGPAVKAIEAVLQALESAY